MTITLENISKTINKTNVLKEISIILESGRVYGLSGPNGSGKTMIMRILSGLITPTSGNLLCDGKSIIRNVPQHVDIGLLIEQPAFLESFSGFSNLKLLSHIRGIIGENDIEKTMLRVGLDSAERKPYKKYSLGMKQRLGIAAAIMEKPDFIILDEPTNALDISGSEMLCHIIEQESKRGATIVLACHEISVLKDLCDTIYYIENGQIIKKEILDEVIERA